MRRDVIKRAAEVYRGTYMIFPDVIVLAIEYYGSDRKIPATFSLVYFIGWSSSGKQPKAKERGEYATNLKTIL